MPNEMHIKGTNIIVKFEEYTELQKRVMFRVRVAYEQGNKELARYWLFHWKRLSTLHSEYLINYPNSYK